jgi:hypothetical protein
MTPFRTDPRWYQEHWYGDPTSESEADAPPKWPTGRFGRFAAYLGSRHESALTVRFVRTSRELTRRAARVCRGIA